MSDVPIHGASCLEAKTYAQRAVAIDDGAAALFDLNNKMLLVPPNPSPDLHPYGPLVGLQCGPSVQGAVLVTTVVLHTQTGRVNAVVAVAATRNGDVASIAKAPKGSLALTPITGPLIDIPRRALGLDTPRPESTVADLVDSLWLDRVLRLVLDSDLGSEHEWGQFAALHPLADNQVCSARELLRRRCQLDCLVSWSTVRDRATHGGAFDGCPTPDIAKWLDDGSFSRWCHAGLPDQMTVLNDLEELIGADIVGMIETTLGLA